jgi:hypothetical protein
VAGIGFGVAAEEDAVRENAGAIAGVPKGSNDVEKVSVVTLLGRQCAERLETLVRVVRGGDAGRIVISSNPVYQPLGVPECASIRR